MGAAQSSQPRSVSMDNPIPAGIIDISDDVVNRLKSGIKKQVQDNIKAEKSSAKKESTSRPAKAATSTATPAVATAKKPSVAYQNSPQVFYVAPAGATLSALDVQRQKEVELQQNDVVWRQRMAKLEETLKKTNSIMETEYSSAVEDVRKRFATASPIHQLPPCQDLKAQVIACYRANPRETLKCSQEVAAFRNCVNLNRIKKLDSVDGSQVKTDTSSTKSPKAA